MNAIVHSAHYINQTHLFQATGECFFERDFLFSQYFLFYQRMFLHSPVQNYFRLTVDQFHLVTVLFSNKKRRVPVNLFTISFHFLFITFSRDLKRKVLLILSYQRTGISFKQNFHCGVLPFNIYCYLELALRQTCVCICQYSELHYSQRGLLTLHILAMYPKYLLSIFIYSLYCCWSSLPLVMALSSQTLRQGKKTVWSGFGLSQALHNMQADQGGDVRSLVNRSQPKLSRKFQFFQPKFKFYRINFLLTDSV